MKRFGLAIAVGLLAFVWLSPAQAAARWFTATVDAAGATAAGRVAIRLTDNKGAFTLKYFFAQERVQNAMLATALTAITLGNEVMVHTDPDLAGTPYLNHLYMKK